MGESKEIPPTGFSEGESVEGRKGFALCLCLYLAQMTFRLSVSMRIRAVYYCALSTVLRIW